MSSRKKPSSSDVRAEIKDFMLEKKDEVRLQMSRLKKGERTPTSYTSNERKSARYLRTRLSDALRREGLSASEARKRSEQIWNEVGKEVMQDA